VANPDHRWQFFRAGGVDQVSLRDGADLHALAELDPKLWVALAMPAQHVHLDASTLALIDLDGDGRVRVHDILEAVRWVEATFKSPGDVLKAADELPLAAIADGKILASAKRILADLGRADARSITVADTVAVTKAFADTSLNGDGVIIPASAGQDDVDARRAIEDAIACCGSVVDRSGKPGVDRALVERFFAAVDERVAWIRAGRAEGLAVLGAATAEAAAALVAVRAKIEDFFTRCGVAAYDPRGAAALAGADTALAALAARSLSTGDEELARLPLARIDATGQLPLRGGLNPAWSTRIEAFVTAVLTPLAAAAAARGTLDAGTLAAVGERLAPYLAWSSGAPKTPVDALDAAWLERLAGPEIRARVHAAVDADLALAGEYDQLKGVEKAVRLQRDFGRVLRNFVNFSEFYSRQEGAFQAGTLYLDARELRLCVHVADAASHAALASSSDAYLIYCDIARKGETRCIAAVLTNGDADNIFVGRNGIFYDRDGNDWDATVTKVVTNPISIREAFWSPYKKLVKVIEDNITKRAQAADAAATAKVEHAGSVVATADKTVAEPPALPTKKIDLGTVAALGVAVGGIGTLVGALLGTMFGLGAWLPVGLAALMLLISGPAMLLAWLKLRRRNLGPILDANRWAINGRARINIPFGAAMTELAKLPAGSQRGLDDPYAERRTRWRLWLTLAVIVLLAGTWFVGRLDRWLPRAIRSTEVLGDLAPAAAKAPAAPSPATSPK
jgi:hypothetical protein